MKKEMKTFLPYTRPVCKTVTVNLKSQVLQGSNGVYDVTNPFGDYSEEEEI